MRRRPYEDYSFLSRELLRAVGSDITGQRLPVEMNDQLPMLAHATEHHLLEQARPLGTAVAGDYLHIPRMRLDLADRRAGLRSWAAAMYTNHPAATRRPEPDATLLVLIGPVEDCRELGASPHTTAMPVPGTTSLMGLAVTAMAAYECIGATGVTVPELAQDLIGPSWPHREREALARVVIRAPAQPPYTTIVIGTPVWVRNLLDR